MLIRVTTLYLLLFSLTTFAEPMVTELGDTAFGGHDLSPWGMYLAADWVVKGVMLGLLAASILTWAIFLLKVRQLFTARRDTQALLRHLIESENLAVAKQGAQTHAADASLLLSACHHELALSAKGAVTDEGIKERVQARLSRVQASLLAKMNEGTGVLATVGSVGPFVGLFGTVWGIMNSFIGIAKTQTTNLAVVAPGIAEALLATAIGLVAAIPAVILYNHFSRVIAGYKAQLGDVSAAILVLLSRDLDRQHPQARNLSLLQGEVKSGV